MREHVQWIPTRFDLLQTRIILLVVHRRPWNAGCIERCVCQIDIGMVDECPVVGVPGNGNAARISEQSAVKLSHPGEIVLGLSRIDPACGAWSREQISAVESTRCTESGLARNRLLNCLSRVARYCGSFGVARMDMDHSARVLSFRTTFLTYDRGASRTMNALKRLRAPAITSGFPCCQA